MDAERENIVRKVYLSAIADHADYISRYARKLMNAKHEQQCTQEELSEAVDGYEAAGIVTYNYKLEDLIENEQLLDGIKFSFSSPFEV